MQCIDVTRMLTSLADTTEKAKESLVISNSVHVDSKHTVLSSAMKAKTSKDKHVW